MMAAARRFALWCASSAIVAVGSWLPFPVWGTAATAASLPERAREYLPVLREVTGLKWPGFCRVDVLAAQVEQETCPSLKHRFCWNPRAELKTDREYGFGLGQLTVTPRFNNFEAARGWDAELRDWAWEDRFDARRQLVALVVYDRNLWRSVPAAATDDDRLAFTLSAYNGGLGGLIKDRRLCAGEPACDPGRWWGHVERHSFRARTAVDGYAKSFYEINRGYVRDVMRVRSRRYSAWSTCE